MPPRVWLPLAGWRRGWLTVPAAAALLAAIGWLSIARSPATDAEARARLTRRQPAPSELNVLVVTLDTLRADRLGCYGFSGIETPRIDALASEGVLFERATATVPLTFPSHASIFTGLIPPHHGVRDNGGFFLGEEKTTLAERFKAAGYATGAFVGAWVLESKWGLAQGFDTYSDKFDLSKFKVVSLGTVQKPGDEVANNALGWVDSVRGRKFFAWVHLYDPHTPYDPPEPFRSRYPREPYLGEVAYTDHVVGRLLDGLRDRGLSERTLIVLTADHGESLGDHGESTHAYFIYGATTHVPLILRTPWGDRGRSRAAVSSVDVFPTVLDLAGLAPEEGMIDGRSLARAVLDPGADVGGAAYAESYFPRYHFGWQHLRGLRDGRFQYVDAPEPELYDLDQDPGETSNIYKSFSKRADEMRQALEAKVGEEGEAAPERKKLDPETLQRLAALGYVGNVSDIDPKALLPDPKHKLPVFKQMNAAKAAAQAERLDEAIEKMRQALAQDPKIIDAHLTLGNWLVKKDRQDEAAAQFKEALALKPDHEIAIVNLANIYRARGENDAAIEGYKSALVLDPKSPQTWYQLATLYLDLGRVADAERTFRQALEANPKMGAAYNSLGVIAYTRGQVTEAERLVRRGLELEPRVRAGHYNLARLAEARGRAPEAERLYREELEIYPDHGRARFNLAQLLREGGDRAGYLRELEAGVERAPEFGACFFFLAREELGAGRLERAAELARQGLEAENRTEVAPLGHYVLADVLNRQGRPAEAQEQASKARKLEAAIRAQPRPVI